MGRLRFSIAGMMVLVLAVSVGFASLRFPSEPIAGIVLLLTLGAFALAVLAVVYRRGERRAFWLGFALLGWGYMALTAATWWDRGTDRSTLFTSLILDHVSSHMVTGLTAKTASSFLASLLGRDPRSTMILTKLEEPVSMSFANATPLEDVLKYIKSATQGPNDIGIQIYVDQAGLFQAEKTPTSSVMLDVEGVPLKTTLRLLLNQLGLTYSVRDGLLMITKITKEAVDDPFRRIGHCYRALLMACFGGLAGRALHNTNTRDTAPG